jgi:SNF2 family DNA or RNA helicase
MWVLHTHWQPPRKPTDPGGILFWAETSESPAPWYMEGEIPEKPKPQEHPYCLKPETIKDRIGIGTPLESAQANLVTLHMPSTRTGPIPSPTLNHVWELDLETDPFLAPWRIDGLWLPASSAFSVLINLPTESEFGDFILGQDAIYWQNVCSLTLEILSEQKILPIMVPINSNRDAFHARWQPVLDGPNDGPRIAKLVEAIPPICRAESLHGDRIFPGSLPPARALLDSFLNTMTDALARSWGSGSEAIRLIPENPTPFEAWVKALFTQDANIKVSAVQATALYSSVRAWMRNLQAAGDNYFRVAFELISPEAQIFNPEEKTWILKYLLQSRDDPSLTISAEQIWNTRTATLMVNDKRCEYPQEKLLMGLGYVTRHFEPIVESLQTRYPLGTTINTHQAYHFLRETAPLLEEAGFGILAPDWWDQKGARLGVRLQLTPSSPAPAVTGISGKLKLNALINYRWELSIGETLLTREEFEALAALNEPLVQLDGKWVQLDQEQVEAARRFWDTEGQDGQMGLIQAAQYVLGGETGAEGLPIEGVDAEGWVEEWLEGLDGHEKMINLPQPQSLEGQLRPYQKFGFSWLSFYRRWGLGAILADDMGLGKTIQALALLLHEKESLGGSLPGPVILVCPTSVATNWQRETQRFAPTLKIHKHQGPDRLRDKDFIKVAKSCDLVITSYPLLRQDIDAIQSIRWYGVILDEAQNIKNPTAKQTQAARSLKSEFRFALTGTPVENRLMELWSIMQFLNPGYLGARDRFKREFALPIERFRDPDATQQLRDLVSPFILRRVKTDPTVITDLPEKIETKAYSNLTEEQAGLYQAVVNDVMKKIDQSEGIERHGQVLAMLTKLKQICNHPIQYTRTKGDLLPTAREMHNRSGKLKRLKEMLEEIIAVGDRVLIFTQFAEMGKLLNAYIPSTLNCQTIFLHGGTPAKMRDQMISRFMDDPVGPQVFILSLKAGGTGLNLTRANHVIHFDRWWNPAVENQATDRAFRIGQHQNVQVHKFVTVGTLEEKIDEMIESKKGLAESIIGSGENWITELSTDELQDLVRLRYQDQE